MPVITTLNVNRFIWSLLRAVIYSFERVSDGRAMASP
jgi:hypothetical protein